MVVAKNSWQTLLARLLNENGLGEKLAEELEVHPDTIQRWSDGKTPRQPLSRLRNLVNAKSFPEEYKSAFIEAVQRSYPDFVVYEDPLKPPVREIPSLFFMQLLRALASVENSLIFWTLGNIISHQLVGHLDPDQTAGVAVTILICTPPSEGRVIRSLQVPIRQFGLPILPRRYPLLVGLENGFDIHPRYQQPTILGAEEIREMESTPFPESVHSLFSVPIQRRGRVAGICVVTSTKHDFFTQERSLIAGEYGMLFLLAFADHDFHETGDIHLDVFPSARRQDEAEIAFPFRDRIKRLRQTHNVSQAALETLALQELEQDLLQRKDP